MKVLKKINVDIFRVIAALMIVAIHIYPLASISETADFVLTRVLFRVAVPFFLMVTGYFVLPKALDKIDDLKKYTWKIVKLYLISILIYLPINIYNGYFNNFNILSFLKDILITGTMYHLWYFPALILGLWITYFLLKYLKKNVVGVIILILYIIGLMGDSYYGFISGNIFLRQAYDIIFKVFDYTRCGLLYVPIFLYMGYMIKMGKRKMTVKKELILLPIFLLLMLIEGMLLYHFKIGRHSSCYIFLIPTAYLLFDLIINQNKGSNKKWRNMALWIYILHPLFIVAVHFISSLPHLSLLAVNNMVNYLIVIILTVGFIYVFTLIGGLIKKWIMNYRQAELGQK